MRRLGFVGAFLTSLTLTAAALAGPNAGGTITLHWNAGIVYTPDATWLEGGLTQCAQSEAQAPAASSFPDPQDSERRIWFAYAAFPDGSHPRLKGVVFGITYTAFATPAGVHVDWQLAPPGSTEIRTTNPAWPEPDSGTSLVFGTTMTAPVNEIYVFAGYGSSGEVFSLRPHPTQPSQFADDAVRPELDDIAGFGTLGFGVGGQRACPTLLLGACCHPDGSCEYVGEQACLDAGGAYQGDGTICSPNPCPPSSGACCFPNGDCRLLSASDCAEAGGDWLGFGTSCTPNLCPPPEGACCYPDGSCRFTFESACATGDWRERVPCVPNPCPPPPGPCTPNPRPHQAIGSIARSDPGRDLATHAPGVEKSSFVGDNLRDTREGGESWNDACEIVSLPFSDLGATCDNLDDITLPCAASAAPDVVYSYTPSLNTTINVSLCGSGYDCALGIYDQNQNNIACNDDFCGLQSQIDNIHVTAGLIYYIVVDGFSTNCGSYVLNVTEWADCEIDCPAGAQPEGEPPCSDGYVDLYNSGCFTSGWTPICPESGTSAEVCGKSGTYLFEGVSYRDTDWYSCLASGGTVTATCRAEFPLQFIFIYGTDCSNLQYDLVTAGPCEDAVLSRDVEAGREFWIWVGPSQFDGIPCESDYVLTVDGLGPCLGVTGACCYPDGACRRLLQTTCEEGGGVYQGDETSCVPNPCAQPSGACCLGDGSCQFVPEAVCLDLGGTWRGFGSECVPNPCPQPGACCADDGFCAYVTPEQCSTGDFRPGEPCDPNPCPQPGACCVPDGSCRFVPERLCTNGEWHAGLPCEPNPCPPPLGACCYADEHCEYVLGPDCPTGDWHAVVSCTPNPCGLGACCYPDGHCEYVVQLSCPTGAWQQEIACAPNPCSAPPDMGACCWLGHCSYATEANCPTGDWRLGVPCNPNPCPQPPNPCNPARPLHGGPNVVSGGVPRDLANFYQPIDKASYVGDNLGDTREGGETFGSAIPIGSLPFSDSGATCDNIDDITICCAASAAPDVVYSYTPHVNGMMSVSLCGSSYDCALAVYDQNQNCVCCNDDFCGLQSEIDNIRLTADQTLYFVVDGFSTNCGSYVFSISEGAPQGCVLDCPAGALIEGEPPCADNYYDAFNGGCNTSGWTILCPQQGNSTVVCGKSGNYLYNGFSYRDTDWYTVYGTGGTMTATWRAEFPIQCIFIYGTDCNNLQYDLATGAPCQDVVLSRQVPAGAAVWLWAGPSVFNGVPCESDYVLTVVGVGMGSGCEVVPVEKTSWGKIKTRFR